MCECEYNKCKQQPMYKYIGHNICEDHWQKLCDADGKTEQRLLRQIGLTRSESGKVVNIAANS